jgi:hypothetical protein
MDICRCGAGNRMSSWRSLQHGCMPRRLLSTALVGCLLFLAVGCGSGGGGSSPGDRGSADQVATTIAGTVVSGAGAASGVAVVLYRVSAPATAVATTTTDAQGSYSFTIGSDDPADYLVGFDLP